MKKVKKYVVCAYYTCRQSVEVEADSEEEAINKAVFPRDLPFEDFSHIQDYAAFPIEDEDEPEDDGDNLF